MKKKLAVLLVAAMTLSTAVPAFAHQVVVKGPAEETVKEEVVKEEAPAEEAAAPDETTAVEKAEPFVTSPNKESDRTVITEDGASTTFKKPKEPKTIYNTAPSAQHPFIDLTGANEDYGRAAFALGMTWGVTKDAYFSPDTTLSTEDAVTFLYRLKGGEGKNGIILAKISEANGYAVNPLTWAAGLGLVDKSVEPKKAITVSELKDMIEKLGYKTNIVGTDNSMTRIDGLKLILDSIVGELDKVNVTKSVITTIGGGSTTDKVNEDQPRAER
ncbi:MAG: hypothetical protein PUD43_02965 [Clostridia bacterium]|nr:hypothetical protein [Clostridia bacterium]